MIPTIQACIITPTMDCKQMSQLNSIPEMESEFSKGYIEKPVNKPHSVLAPPYSHGISKGWGMKKLYDPEWLKNYFLTKKQKW